MSSIIEYVDDDGQTIRGVPVVIIADRTLASQSAGSKTDFFDSDGRMVRATPLVIVEDHRPGGSAPGTSTTIVNDLVSGGVAAALSAEQGKALKTQVDAKADAASTSVALAGKADAAATAAAISGKADASATAAALAAKQPTLVSGSNIKTLGGQSLLGSGDIALPTGGSATVVVNDLSTGGVGSALSAEQGKVLKAQVDAKAEASALASKQAALVSGSNIKTVGGQSLLGAGDIPLPAGGSSTPIVNDLTTGGTAAAASAETVKTLKTQVDAKLDKATAGNTVTVSGNMTAAHVGKVIIVDTSSAPVVLTLVPGVITSASDRITYKRKGGNPLTFAAANGATLNDPHLMQVIDGDLVVIAGTALDTATVAGMPGDLVRKSRANLYTARQAIAPATLTIVGGNVALDASLSNNFTLSLTENATLSNPTALLGGQSGTIDVTNAGAFALTFGTMWRPVVGATTAVKQGAGGFSMITFKVSADGTKILYNIIQEQ